MLTIPLTSPVTAGVAASSVRPGEPGTILRYMHQFQQEFMAHRQLNLDFVGQPEDRYAQAIRYAARTMATSRPRKIENRPVIFHTLRTALYLVKYGLKDETLLLAAILHDSIEDGEATAEEIECYFGPDVASLVVGATEEDKSVDWELRKQRNLDILRKATEAQVLLAAADKLDGVTMLLTAYDQQGAAVWNFFKRSREELLAYHSRRAAVFVKRMNGQNQELVLALLDAENRLKQCQ